VGEKPVALPERRDGVIVNVVPDGARAKLRRAVSPLQRRVSAERSVAMGNGLTVTGTSSVSEGQPPAFATTAYTTCAGVAPLLVRASRSESPFPGEAPAMAGATLRTVHEIEAPVGTGRKRIMLLSAEQTVGVAGEAERVGFGFTLYTT
jgi:hypothetical protein